jgi:flap endonuclease-1
MGITGLKKVIRTHAPAAYVETHLDHIRGWKLGVDASIACYQIAITSNNNMRVFRRLALGRVQSFDKLECVAVWVFDGRPPALKEFELERRRKVAAKAEERGATMISVTSEHFRVLREIILACGQQVVDAPSEAEAQCAYMCRDGLVDAVVTEDGDALTFGAKKVIFGYKSNARTVNIITLADVLQGMQLTMSSFVDMCILLGCDYGPHIPNVGPKKVVPWICKLHTIEQVMIARKLVPPPEFVWVRPRLLFTDHEYTPTVLAPPAANPDWIREMLQRDHEEAARESEGVWEDA